MICVARFCAKSAEVGTFNCGGPLMVTEIDRRSGGCWMQSGRNGSVIVSATIDESEIPQESQGSVDVGRRCRRW